MGPSASNPWGVAKELNFNHRIKGQPGLEVTSGDRGAQPHSKQGQTEQGARGWVQLGCISKDGISTGSRGHLFCHPHSEQEFPTCSERIPWFSVCSHCPLSCHRSLAAASPLSPPVISTHTDKVSPWVSFLLAAQSQLSQPLVHLKPQNTFAPPPSVQRWSLSQPHRPLRDHFNAL